MCQFRIWPRSNVGQAILAAAAFQAASLVYSRELLYSLNTTIGVSQCERRPLHCDGVGMPRFAHFWFSPVVVPPSPANRMASAGKAIVPPDRTLAAAGPLKGGCSQDWLPHKS